MSETLLEAVKADDRQMVGDILRVLRSLSYCTTFTINLAPKGYEILSYLNKDGVEVAYEDLGLLEQTNPLRVKCMGVRVHSDASCIRIRVISLSEPCMMSETILVKTRKRSRWYE
jgi:hypothetical protein